MDFNLKKFASEASTAFTRAVQFTEEKLGKAERTELDAHFEALLARADSTEEHTRRMLACMESYLQQNPTLRMEELLYDKLDMKRDVRQYNVELLGASMVAAGEEFGGENSPYGDALGRIGATQLRIGAAERLLVETAAQTALAPIKQFLDGDMRTIAKERKLLMTKRLDLDASKTRLRKAKGVETQANTTPKQSGHMTVEQAEADLRVAQCEFDKQGEILKLLLEGMQSAHTSHLKCVRNFAEAQMSFYAQAHQQMSDLQRELSGHETALNGGQP